MIMHYYKRHLGDYAKKAGRLSMLEHGAYTLLIDSCYDRERFPTKEEAIKWCWARSAEEIAAVEFVLSQFFELDGEHYMQPRIQEEIDSYHEKAITNKRIALEREEQRRAKRTQNEHETCTNEHETPPNHKPITINQEPIDKHLLSSVDDDGLAKVKKKHMTREQCQQIIDQYNEKLGDDLPRVQLLNKKRESAIRARYSEMLNTVGLNGKPRFTNFDEGLVWFGRVFAKVKLKTHWIGENDNGWKANFDWLMTPARFTELIEFVPPRKEK